MKRWLQSSKELKIMGVLLLNQSAILTQTQIKFYGYRFGQEGLMQADPREGRGYP